MKKIIITLIVFAFGMIRLTAATLTWVGGTDSLWSTAANWSPAAVPTAADDVVFNSNAALSLIGSQTVISITVNAGARVIFNNSSASSKNLTLTGTSSIAGILQLVPTGQIATNSARIILGAGAILNVSGTLEAGGGNTTANNVTITGGTLNVTGTFIYSNTFTATGGVLNVESGGRVVVKAGSTTTGADATTVQVKSGATWEHARNGGTIAVCNYATGSTLAITGCTTTTTALAFPAAVTNYSTVTFENTGQASNLTLPTGLTMGTLNINSTGAGANVIRLASGSTIGAIALTVNNALNIASNTSFYLIFTTGTNTQTPSVNLTMGSNSTVNIASGGTLGLSDKSSLGGVLTLGSGATLNSNGNLACSGALSYIDGAGSVNLNSGGFTRIGDPAGIVAGSTTTGNIRNGGARTFSANHDWSFNAQGNSQVTGDGMASTCANFTCNSNVGVTLSKPLTISSTLTITGNLSLANFDLTTTTISGGTQATHVITNGTGKLIVPNMSATTFFPVGITSASFDPVYITPLSNSTFGVRVDDVFDNAPADPTKVINREWNIARTAGSGTAEISFVYDAAAVTGASYSPASPVVVGRRTGSNWLETAATLAGTTATLTGLTSFAAFGIGNTNAFAVVIPVELVDFKAKNNAKNVLLNWQTASERNSEAFDIERSIDGVSFKTIGTVKAHGNSAVKNDYVFADNTPLSINYYRLRQMDNDGTATLSKTITVSRNEGKSATIKLYPSVSDAQITLETGVISNATIEVVDITGRLYTTKTINDGASVQQMDISALPRGMYWLRVKSNEANVVLSFVKQ